MKTDLELLRINRSRFLKTFKQSSAIGSTAGGGLNRLALTETDKKMRDLFIKWLEQADLDVRIDDLGNIYGKREGKINDAPVIAVGSHLDTQPTGGRFDGVLGVLAALEVIRTLNDQKIETDYPIEIINFTNEEGARFSPPMVGSGGLAGVFKKDYIYNLKDDAGITFKSALNSIGYLGDIKNRIKNIKNYIELHIEQGPVLESSDRSIGIVEGIQGMSWIKIKVVGQNSHAGPTPMENRKDALVAAAKMIVAINELTNRYDGLLTTVGKISNYPNVENIVPGEVELKIDIRHTDDSIRKIAIDELIEQCSTIALSQSLDLTCTVEWDISTTNFSHDVIDTVEDVCKVLNYSTLRMYSGAGHDAKYMNDITKSGMIFVKSIGGISHNEDELTLDEDLIKGANVLLQTILKLSSKDE